MSDITEPALRPHSQGLAGLDIMRRARVHRAGCELVMTTRRGGRRDFPVGGEDGIRRAVYLDAGKSPGTGAAASTRPHLGPASVTGRAGPPVPLSSCPSSWGLLQLQDGTGKLLARLPVAPWTPESSHLAQRPAADGEELLHRAGISGLLRACGITQHIVSDPADPLLDRATPDRAAPLLTPGPVLPRWYAVTRWITRPVWAVAAVTAVLTGLSHPWPAVVMAVATAVYAAARTAVRLWTWWTVRHGPGRPAVVTRIAPAPPPGAGATERFRRTAALRVQERDLVLVDSAGHERWLPLSGPHSAAAPVRILSHGTREPLGVELRGPDGQLRAALPWDWWFGGPDGDAGWVALRSALARPATDRELRKREDWLAGPLVRADTAALAPLPPAVARRDARHPESGIAAASTGAVTALMPLLTLVMGVSLAGSQGEGGAAAVTLTLGAVACCALALPPAVHSLRSRLWLDRPDLGRPDPGRSASGQDVVRRVTS